MNLFEKYGIKEVADVVFYSINQIGDDEIIYTPVLFLDTLKVSTYEKSAESVFATGGLRNKNLIKWNFGKNIKFTLEDALFSPASMSLIWGGKLDSKLSDATSVVSKINFANTYGRLQYSVKAYPSPALTKNEWEIVFKIIGSSFGFDTKPDNYNGTSWLLDNNYYSNLPDNYKKVFQKRYAERPYLFNGIEETGEKSTYSYDMIQFGTSFDENYLQIPMMQIDGYEGINEHYDSEGKLKRGHERWYQAKALPEYIIYIIRKEISELNHIGEIENNIQQFEVMDRMEKCLVDKKGGLIINGKQQMDNLFRYYADDKSSSYTIYYDTKTMLPLVQIKNDRIVKNNQSYNIKKRDITRTQLSISLNTSEGQAVIRNYFKNLAKGTVFTRADILALDPNYESGGNRHSYLDYSFKRDVCQLLPVTDPFYGNASHIFDYEVEWQGWPDDKQPDENWTVANGDFIYLSVSSSEDQGESSFKIKYGTTYYKWTRTVKYKEYEDDGILGQSFIIDADTFPADYRIVGETYIRNQKTGKDQRYQITIFRANVSSDTSITLQADGDPTTFTMDIDVLTPENDIMMEMRQIDVEEDRFEGGTRIVPQRGKYTYTPAMADAGEVLTPIDNNEIY